MTESQLILLLIIAAALVLILSNRLRSDLVALLVLLSLYMTGLVSAAEAISGFSNPAIVTLFGLFMISHALEDTGIAQRIGNRLRSLGGSSEPWLIFLLMSTAALFSLIMNNIAAGAVLLPIAIDVAGEANIKPSRLLIPVAFGTLLGGMATYFTTANIILNGVLIQSGQTGLTMLDFLPTGGVICLAGILMMVTAGRKLLPVRVSVGQAASAADLNRSLAQAYQLDDRLWEARILPHSHLINVPLSQSQIGGELGLTVLAIWRGQEAILNPDPAEELKLEDYLLIMGRQDRVETLKDWGIAIGRDDQNGHLQNFAVDLTEVIIPPRSNVIGKTLQELRFRERSELTSVALWREGRSYRTDVGKFRLDVGDALLMVGKPAKIDLLARDPNFMVMKSGHAARPQNTQKALIAAIITVIALALSIFEIVPTPLAMLAGGAAVVLTRCIDMDEAYRSIEWRVIFLIAGMLPLSIAMVSTGLADNVGTAIIRIFGSGSSLVFIAGVFLVTMLITQVIAGQVSALIMGPIAVTAALQIGVDPQAVAVATAIACSTAFLTPISHAVNMLIMGPGGYIPRDFPRIGTPLTIVVFGGLMFGMIVFWGIR